MDNFLEAYNKLKENLKREIQLNRYNKVNNAIEVYVPCDSSPIEILLDGVHTKDIYRHVISEINIRLDNMIELLGDCKL